MTRSVRPSPGPSRSAIVLRLIVLAAGWAALLMAVPSALYRVAPVVVVLGAAALSAATTIVPRRHAALVLELGVVAGWLLPGEHVGRPAVTAVVLASVLYVHSVGAALAVATGWDVRIDWSLARAVSVRTGVTVGIAAVISVGMLAAEGLDTAALPNAILLAGLVAAVAAVALPLVALRRPPPVSDQDRRPLR